MKYSWKYHPGLKAMLIISATIICVSVIFTIAVMFSTYYDQQLSVMDFCLSDRCVDLWIKKNHSALSILSRAGTITVGVFTLWGIAIALLSYQNSVYSSGISNHLAHISLFSSYVEGEVDRKSRLSASSFEPLKWYNMIYPYSSEGRFSPSEEYVGFISSVNESIERSNGLYSGLKSKANSDYRYKIHQAEMIAHLDVLGIYLEHLPRVDFNEVETQVFELIDSVNKSFCKSKKVPFILGRVYI